MKRKEVHNMILEVYHANFYEDIINLSRLLDKRKFYECLVQIDKTIEQILLSPNKPAALKYAPLLEYRKKKFFSNRYPLSKQRPNMRLLYRYVPVEKTIYILSVGFRIATKPRNPNDVYQRTKKRSLLDWI